MPRLWPIGPPEFGFHSLLEPLPLPDSTLNPGCNNTVLGHYKKQNAKLRPYLPEAPAQSSLNLQLGDGFLIPTPRTGQAPKSPRTIYCDQRYAA